jgi:hypothetical protein
VRTDHPIIRRELHEIHAAKSSSVLVLMPASQAKINALDLEGKARNVITPKR